jgi:hypothetical protein
MSTRSSLQAKKQKKLTALKTSAVSRVAVHRAGSLDSIEPQKSERRRIELLAFADVPPRDTQAVTDTKPTVTNIDPPDTSEQRYAATAQITAPEDSTETTAAEQDANDPTGTVTLPAASTTDNTPATSTDNSGAPVPSPAKLYASRITYDQNTIIAEGDEGSPVRLVSNDVRVYAKRVVLDTQAKTIVAQGQVRVERDVTTKRFNAFRPHSSKSPKYDRELISETLKGENFEYNFGTRQGHLDHTSIRLTNFNITADQLTINGQKYIARNVVVRPGGLSEKELEIYGTPPFNLRAKTVIVDNARATHSPGSDDKLVSNTPSTTPRTEVHNAALYFRNLRLFPVPSALLRRSGAPREEETYQITPRIFFNSADGILLTARIQYPLIRPSQKQENSSHSPTLDLITDLGISTRVGFRGGVELDSDSRIGELSLNARVNDVVSSQLTDRIELDRLPEVRYRPPSLRLFRLPGSRAAGLRFSFTAGDYRESLTSQARTIKDTKLEAQVLFTTLMGKKEGAYFNLFARSAMYGNHPDNLNTQGFEVGYIGHLTSRINGQFSFRAQNVDGSTPFRFDEVEIRRELRTTFDVMLTPRWLVPIDLRYDVDRGELRNKSFGLLRNYKTFAYGLMYESARHELRFELRQGF